MADVQAVLAGGDPLQGATLTFPTLAVSLTVACVHTELLIDFTMLATGRSSKFLIERCEFLAASFQAADRRNIRKGLKCVLSIPGDNQYHLQLWDGGIQQGGLVYRFTLADEDYDV